MIKNIRKKVVSALTNMQERNAIMVVIAIVLVGFAISTYCFYLYLCAIAYTGNMLGIGNWIFLILIPLTSCVTYNGNTYAVIMNDFYRSIVNAVVFVGCFVTYIFF